MALGNTRLIGVIAVIRVRCVVILLMRPVSSTAEFSPRFIDGSKGTSHEISDFGARRRTQAFAFGGSVCD
jgi:hypothetical protein